MDKNQWRISPVVPVAAGEPVWLVRHVWLGTVWHGLIKTWQKRKKLGATRNS